MKKNTINTIKKLKRNTKNIIKKLKKNTTNIIKKLKKNTIRKAVVFLASARAQAVTTVRDKSVI